MEGDCEKEEDKLQACCLLSAGTVLKNFLNRTKNTERCSVSECIRNGVSVQVTGETFILTSSHCCLLIVHGGI